jgi:gamma-glutamylcyclotransferase (GGCT)/AIG2-like uncharacterized protein YtfP
MIAAGAMALVNLLGTGLSIYGSLREAEEFKRISEQNAQLARFAADDAVARGSFEVYKRRLESSRKRGEISVATAAGGVSVTGGSAELLRLDEQLAADLDALVLSNNAAREAWGYEREATEFERAGKRAKQDAILGSVAQGLGGAISAYSTASGGK